MTRKDRGSQTVKKDYNNEERSVKRPTAPGKKTPPKLPKKNESK